MKAKFSPSLMCMDLLDIKNQIELLNTRADMFHVDIMDGHYVKNIALSPDFIKAIKPICNIPLDCHLMVTNPDQYIEPLVKAGVTYICPHAEIIKDEAFRMINKIKGFGCKVGVVLNPATPLSYIQEYIHLLDKITIMSVHPGFAGQPFIKEVLGKIKEAKKLKEENHYNYLIEVDGSCNEKTFAELKEAGVEVFIVGNSGLFDLAKDIPTAWNKMMEIFEKS